jgi:hypothetical protein
MLKPQVKHRVQWGSCETDKRRGAMIKSLENTGKGRVIVASVFTVVCDSEVTKKVTKSAISGVVW